MAILKKCNECGKRFSITKRRVVYDICLSCGEKRIVKIEHKDAKDKKEKTDE